MGIPNPYTLPTIEFVGGSTQDLMFHAYFQANKRAFDLDGCSAEFAVIDYTNQDGGDLFTKPMEILDVGGQVKNTLKVTLDSEDTVDWSGKYVYQITIIDNASGDVEIPKQGIMLVYRNFAPPVILLAD